MPNLANDLLLNYALSFLSLTSNIIFFRSSLFTQTLFDITTIMCHRPHNTIIFLALNLNGASKFNAGLNQKADLIYTKFIMRFTSNGRTPRNSVRKEEHIAFLLYRLCHDIFYTPKKSTEILFQSPSCQPVRNQLSVLASFSSYTDKSLNLSSHYTRRRVPYLLVLVAWFSNFSKSTFGHISLLSAERLLIRVPFGSLILMDLHQAARNPLIQGSHPNFFRILSIFFSEEIRSVDSWARLEHDQLVPTSSKSILNILTTKWIHQKQ